MSLQGNDIVENTSENAAMSKRQKKKFEQVLRQIAASQNTDSKSHKKRRNPTERKADPQARKLIKVTNVLDQTESQIQDVKNQEASSSVRENSEEESKASQKTVKRQTKDLHNVYNKKYGIPQETQGFSDYMVNYTYGEKSKYVEKQCDDWSALENLGGNQIVAKTNEKDEQKMRFINDKLSAENGKAPELFSKTSKQLIRKVLDELFPKTSK